MDHPHHVFNGTIAENIYKVYYNINIFNIYTRLTHFL